MISSAIEERSESRNDACENKPSSFCTSLAASTREAGEHAEDMTSEPEGVTYEGVDATAIGQPMLTGSGGNEKAILHHQTPSQERPRCAGLFMLTTYVCY